MHAMCRFRYDREITLWLSGFMGRALPGTCFPDKVDYGIRALPGCDGRAFELDMSLPVRDGTVDIEIEMTVLAGNGSGPAFGGVSATRDVLDENRMHVETQRWDDGEGAWLRVEPCTDDDV